MQRHHADYCIHTGDLLPCVSLTPEEKQQSYQFSHSLSNVEHRAATYGTQLGKFKADFASGKLAEFGAAKYLAQYHHLPLLQPDLEIRSWADREDIMFDSDFIYPFKGRELHVHVKSVRASFIDKYEESYNIQTGDNVYSRPKPEDWICLCIVDDAGAWVKVRGLVRASYVASNGLWGMPRLERFHGTKRYLYAKDLLACSEPKSA